MRFYASTSLQSNHRLLVKSIIVLMHFRSYFLFLNDLREKNYALDTDSNRAPPASQRGTVLTWHMPYPFSHEVLGRDPNQGRN